MRAALLALALAACSYDPRGVLNHEADVDAAAGAPIDAGPPDASVDVTVAPDATPPDANPPDASPPDATPTCGCTGLDFCCADGSCAPLGLCI